ncbi:PLP-dependent aminotransferase family protein [Amaricoccus tamworthensis]|uniref:aminotransferase-like domain-containing protein n=1 Tax=Amaricoccus tamworthensis TaxID=57002 RepID=UPI003C7D8453
MIVADTIWQTNLRASGRSKYRAIAQTIRNGIVSGDLREGEKLPPVRDLAYRIGVTPGTVARAYALLTDEGRLVAGVGRGTYVAGRAGAPVETLPPLIHDPKTVTRDQLHLMSPKMPEVGQGRLMRDAMSHLSQTMPWDHLLQYPNRDSDAAARELFRSSVVDTAVGAVEPEDVVVTNGGQNAVVMILQTVLHGSAPVIAVDELSYGGFRSAARLCRAAVAGVPWDADGPRPDVFEELVRTQGVQIYCTSSEVCNPIVRGVTPARRREIARIADRFGVHIMDDECYRLMRTDRQGPGYRSYLPELTWHVTSPSKSLSAALRIGFVIAPVGWGGALARTSSFNFFGVSRLITDLYAHVMARTELPGILDRVRDRIGNDIRAAVNALGRSKINWSEDVPFLWLELPAGWRAGEFCKALEAENILVKSAEDFSLRDGRAVHAVRIAVNGQVPHEAFVAGMKTVRRLLDTPPDRVFA